MNRRLRIPARKPPLAGEPLPLYLGVPMELRLQLVGADASMASGRGQTAARTALLAKCVGLMDHRGENLERPPCDYLTH
jgi:hypothetical protein